MTILHILAAVLLALLALRVPRLLYEARAVLLQRRRRASSGARGAARIVPVSVVVPAKSEPVELLTGLVYNLAGQACRPLEVIVVWDYPAEGYGRVARRLWRLGERLGLSVRVVVKPWRGRGKAAVLNYAVRLARGDYILVIDVDDRLCDTLSLCRLYEHAARAAVAQSSIRGVAYLHPLQGPTALAIHTGFRVVHEARASLGLVPLLVGSGLIVEKRLAKRLLFDDDSLVEDVDFAVRLAAAGREAIIANDASLCMAGAPGYQAFRRQQVRWSMGSASVARRRIRIILDRLDALRALELIYTLLNYALDPLTTITATLCAAVAIATGTQPLLPLALYATLLYTEALLTSLLSRDAPLARKTRNTATAAAMAAALEPLLLGATLRGLIGQSTTPFHKTPRRPARTEKPGLAETLYLAMVGATGVLLYLYSPSLLTLYAASPLLLRVAALVYLHMRLPQLASENIQTRTPAAKPRARYVHVEHGNRPPRKRRGGRR